MEVRKEAAMVRKERKKKGDIIQREIKKETKKETQKR